MALATAGWPTSSETAARSAARAEARLAAAQGADDRRRGEDPRPGVRRHLDLEDPLPRGSEAAHPRRTAGGYRLYSQADVERLRAILRMQRDEFLPLRVIRQELATGDLGTDRRPAAEAGQKRRAMTVDDAGLDPEPATSARADGRQRASSCASCRSSASSSPSAATAATSSTRPTWRSSARPAELSKLRRRRAATCGSSAPRPTARRRCCSSSSAPACARAARRGARRPSRASRTWPPSAATSSTCCWSATCAGSRPGLAA